MNTPIDAIEPVYPFRFTSYEMRIDSGGPGKWRGGVGLERSWVLETHSAIFSILAERNRLPPWGLFRGKPGATGEYYLTEADGKKTRLRSKCAVNMREGNGLTVRTPGGGGYGNPLEREPRMVLNDVANELVSTKSAKSDYGVVIRPTLLIDEEEMKRPRKKMCQRRVSRQ